MENNTNKLPLSSKIGYLFGDFGSQFCWTFIGSYLSVFYTDVVGIAPAVVTLIFLVARIWDAVNDPMMGAIAERTNTKWGRFRPYILFGTPFLAIFSAMVFTNPGFSMEGKIAFAVITYILAGMLYTVVNVPYGAMSGVMTSNIEERNALAAFRMNGMNIGMLIINFSAMPLILFFSGSDTPSGRGYQITAIIFAIIGFISLYITFFTSKEVIHPVRKEKVPLSETIRTILSNKHLLKVLAIQFFLMCGFMGRIGVVVYYYIYVVKRVDLVSLLMTLPSVSGIIGITVIPTLAARFGKKRMLILTNCATALSLILIYFVPAENIMMLTVMTFIYGLVSVGSPIVFSMIPDAIDYAEYHTGVRADGAAYATSGLAQKAGMAVSGVCVSIMAAFGYVANAEQTAQAIRGINITANLIPAIAFVLAMVVTLMWNLDDEEAQRIRKELDENHIVEKE